MLATKRASLVKWRCAYIHSVASQNTTRTLEQSDKIYEPNKNSVYSVS